MSSKKSCKKEKRKRLQKAIAKTVELIIRSPRRRGKESEEFVLRSSEILREKGKIVNHYRASKRLDKRGIDRVYQTRNGFYLVNIKSSLGGEEQHQFWQSIKQDLLIYSLVRYPGESSESIENKLSEIFRQKPSFTVLPKWINKELKPRGVPIKVGPRSKERSPTRLPALKLVEAQKVFEGIIGIEWVGVVTSLKSSLAKLHVEIVCRTPRGIYPFDIHEKDIAMEGGLVIFPLNLSWPKSKIEEILREKPQETFPAVIYGAILDLE